MSTTTMTSRQFNQDTARAKRAAEDGPVVITDRGEPSHVLMSYHRYLELAEDGPNVVRLLAMEEDAPTEFDPPKAGLRPPAVDLD